MNSALRVFMLGIMSLSAAKAGAEESSQNPIVGGVLQQGLCVHGNATRYAQPQSIAGYATMGSLELTENTTEVPLRPGIGFGFAWKAINLPNPVVITYRIEHPAIQRPDGVMMTHFDENLTLETNGEAIQTVDCYFLSEAYELVAGTWSLSIYFGEQPLAKGTFHVRAQP